MRDYSAHELTLDSEIMANVIVKFYNIIIKFNHYPHRWSKVVDDMIEKVKGPRLKNCEH